MALDLVEINTPAGRLLVPRAEAAMYGVGQPDPSADLGAPALPPPPESPVPDVAPAPLPPDAVSGADVPMAPRLTPGIADSGLVALPGASESPASGASPVDAGAVPGAAQGLQRGAGGAGGGTADLAVPGPEAAPGAAPAPDQTGQAPAERTAPVDLSQLGYGDLVARQQDDLNAQAAANARVGEAEAKALEAQAEMQAQRNAAIAAKEIQAAEDAKREQAEIERKTKLWEAKNEEWMSAKVTRRGISTGELIGVALAGLGSALKGQGGQNPALALVLNKIQTDVDDQIRERDELGRRAGALKGSVDYARDVAKDAQAARMAAIGMEAQRWGREIETVAAKMAPGVKREQVAAQGTELRAKGTEYLVQAKQHQDTLDHQAAQLAQAERESRRAAGVQYARLKEDARQADLADRRARDLAMLDAQKEIAKATASGDVEKAKQLAAAAKEERELGIGGGPMLKGGPAPATAIKGMNALNEALGLAKQRAPGFDEYGRLLQPDGSVFKAPDVVSAQKLRTQVSATVTASNLIDEVLRLRDKHGWSSDLLKSPEWRQMQANKGAIIKEMKNAAELGALSGPDMGLIESMLGTADPTEVRDPAPGLRQAKANMQLSTRNQLALAGYAGDAFVLPDASKEAKAPIDEDGGALMSKGAVMPETEAGGWAGSVANKAIKMTRDQEIGLSELTKRAGAGTKKGATDEEKKDAVSAVHQLARAAQEAQNPKARDAAAAAMVDLIRAGNPAASLYADQASAWMRRKGP